MECGDFLFPSSNSEGIPDLDINMQGDYVDFPLAWGSQARTKSFAGKLIHFYVDDPRFNGMGNAVEYGAAFWKLWERPDKVWASTAPSFIECNFSTSQSQPYAVALHQIYKKRFLSRYWQSRGMRCFVDLNVAPEWEELNLLGVPLGWRAYATRVHRFTDLDLLIHQWELACCHAGSEDLIFLVYGHRNEVKDLCARRGWVYLNEQEAVWQKRNESKAMKRSLQTDIKIEEPKRHTMTLEAWI